MSDILTITSLDPRVTRLNIPVEAAEQNYSPTKELEHLETYEVFHQAKAGAKHIHVGSVHAPNAELAVVFAKEQFARRSQTVNIWVVKTEDVISLAPEDADIFETTPDKNFREASGYKVMQKVNAYRKLKQQEREGGA